MTTEKTYQFGCANCGQQFTVTESEAKAHGWTIFTVQHLGCTAKPITLRDPYDWSKATDREVREMADQLNGDENVSE